MSAAIKHSKAKQIELVQLISTSTGIKRYVAKKQLDYWNYRTLYLRRERRLARILRLDTVTRDAYLIPLSDACDHAFSVLLHLNQELKHRY